MSRGVNENIQLKSKLETQLSRLLDQLEDLENNKDSIDDEEFSELKSETLEQVIMVLKNSKLKADPYSFP